MTDPAPPSLPAAALARKRGRWFWPLQLLPPLLLILLLLSDNGSGFYMTAMLLVLFVGLPSLLAVVLRLGFLAFRRGDPWRLLRPLACIGIVGGAFAYCQWSLREASEVAAAEAARIQAACVQAGRCPDALTIGTGHDGRTREVGTPSTHLRWTLRYLPGDAGFELELLVLMESSQRWTGGPGRELEHVRLVEGRSEAFDD